MVTDHKKSYVGGEDGGESYACMILFQLHLVCVYFYFAQFYSKHKTKMNVKQETVPHENTTTK